MPVETSTGSGSDRDDAFASAPDTRESEHSPETFEDSVAEVPDSPAGSSGVQSEEMATVAPTRKAIDAVPQASLSNGKVVGRYRLERQIGSGGMGIVYEASEIETGRKVALKLLSAGLTGDEENVDRFVREARLAAQISHPRTTFVYEAGQQDGRPYIAMELMPGKTLQDVLDSEKGIPYMRAVDHILDVIDGLAAAHRLNVIHRDVKPSNCFVHSDGRIKVGDFGLSKSLVTDVQLTRTGTFMGTPSFAAPEQIRGDHVDQRTDIYAVGATLFCLIANRAPFVGDAMSVTAQIISDQPEGLKSLVPSVPRDLEKVIERTLRKDPEDRYEDLSELREALLPFSTRGTSLTQIGRRSAAYMIDYLIVGIVVQLIGFVVFLGTGTAGQIASGEEQGVNFAFIQICMTLVSWLSIFAYFAVSEGLFGGSIGKKILGLRVENLDGDTPGIWRGLLRALIIPGAFAIPMIAAIFRWQFGGEVNQDFKISFLIYAFFIARSAELLPVLMCLLTMRNANGLRGIHGFLSGTRVTRTVDETRKQIQALSGLNPIPLTDQKRKQIGPFVVDGVLAKGADRCVYRGMDPALDRRVMIYQLESADDHNELRCNINRPSRARWIQGGVNETGRWDAFEYVNGVPFTVAAQDAKAFTWENTRHALHDLVVEIETSLQEESLPPSVTIDQFFIDRDGHGRLVELPFPTSPEGFPRDSGPDDSESQDVGKSKTSQACQMIDQAFHLVLSKQVVPTSVRRLLNSFRQQGKSKETVDRFAERLEAANKRLPRLNWDSRLGVFAVTLGAEGTTLIGIMLVATWLWVTLFGYAPIWKPAILIAWFSIAFFGVGFGMRSSPVLRFMKIDIQDSSGQIASRFRCGLRNLLSWFPFTVVVVSFVFGASLGFDQIERQRKIALPQRSPDTAIGGQEQGDESNELESESVNDQGRKESKAKRLESDKSQSDAANQARQANEKSDQLLVDNDLVNPALAGDVIPRRKANSEIHPDLEKYPLQVVAVLLAGIFAMALGLAAGLFSIASPERGIQDYVCGTRLVPE